MAGRLLKQQDNVDESKITILVIEDEPEMRRMICMALEARFGYRVLTAFDGPTGITNAVQLQPDLILMDLAMPGMDGVVATRLLKQRNLTRHIPVIAYSNYADIETWQQMAQNAGCIRCIDKHTTHADLDRIIQDVLKQDVLKEVGN